MYRETRNSSSSNHKHEYVLPRNDQLKVLNVGTQRLKVSIKILPVSVLCVETNRCPPHGLNATQKSQQKLGKSRRRFNSTRHYLGRYFPSNFSTQEITLRFSILDVIVVPKNANCLRRQTWHFLAFNNTKGFLMH